MVRNSRAWKAIALAVAFTALATAAEARQHHHHTRHHHVRIAAVQIPLPKARADWEIIHPEQYKRATPVEGRMFVREFWPDFDATFAQVGAR